MVRIVLLAVVLAFVTVVVDLLLFSEEISRTVIDALAVTAAVGLGAFVSRGDKKDSSEPETSDDACRLLERKYKAVVAEKEKLEHDKKMTEMFLASMSHEIRTPLNGIIGLTELLDETELKKEQKEFVSMIRESSDNLRVIVNDVLEISKLNAGKLELEHIPFDIIAKSEAAAGLFFAKAKEKGVELVTSIDADVPRFVKGDPTRYAQVLTNLISNAVKFTPEGGSVTLHVEKTDETDTTATLHVSVTDTGIGLSKEQQEKIFDPYTQASAATTRKAGGTGLGLTISKRIVEAMGGELSVESEPGKGATFYFEVPFEKARGEVKEETSETQDETIQADHKLRVLVAEDNPINQRLIRIVLEKMGLDVTLAENGKEALEARKNGTFDLIFMDVQMPVMGGEEATQKMLAYEKETGAKHVPIIALTANALPGDREKYMAAGMDDYATKPLDVKVIKRLIEKFCA